MWDVGTIIGPFLGGMLSHPAERYPSVFGAFPLLRERPFFLPCLASALINAAAVLLGVFFLKETHPCLMKDKEPNHPNESPPHIEGATEPSLSVHATAFGLLADRNVRGVVLVGFCMSFTSIAMDPVLVLWSYTPLALGGIQQEPAEIGVVLSIVGILGVASTIFALPYLQKWFKSVPLLTVFLVMCGLVYVLIPSVGFVVRKTLPPVGQQEPAPPLGKLWVLVFCTLLVHSIAAMSYPAYMLVVAESIPDSRAVGALFGLVMAANCLAEGTADRKSVV